MNYDELISLAATLALDAGAAILEVRRRGFDVTRKEDRTPVTEADHAAEAVIVRGLRAAMPDVPVIAEEEVAAGHVTQPTATYWLVDPLDGTREFAAGNDEFAVNIGLVRNGRPVLGVVGIPASGELFGGIVGRGAWKRLGTHQTPVSARLPPEEGLTRNAPAKPSTILNELRMMKRPPSCPRIRCALLIMVRSNAAVEPRTPGEASTAGAVSLSSSQRRRDSTATCAHPQTWRHCR